MLNPYVAPPVGPGSGMSHLQPPPEQPVMPALTNSALGPIPGLPTSLPGMPALPTFAPQGTVMPPPSAALPPIDLNLIPGVAGVLQLLNPASTGPPPYDGPPPSDKIKRNDPKVVNEINGGPPLHALDSQEPEGRTIYIANIPQHIAESQILDFFTCVARPVKAKLATPAGKQVQFGFVEFATVADAHSAIGISGTELCGKAIKISQARTTVHSGGTSLEELEDPAVVEQRTRTCYVSNLECSVTESMIKEFFEGKCGEVKTIRLAGENATTGTKYAFVEFKELQAAQIAKMMTGSTLGAFPIKCGEAKHTPAKFDISPPPGMTGDQEVTTQTCHVGNIDRTITEQELRDHFEDCGGISHTYIAPGDPNSDTKYGFVEFSTKEGFKKAFEKSGTVLGSFAIRVNIAKGILPTSGTSAGGNARLNESAGVAAAVQLGCQYVVALKGEKTKYQKWLDDEKERKKKKKEKKEKKKDKKKKRRRYSDSESDSYSGSDGPRKKRRRH